MKQKYLQNKEREKKKRRKLWIALAWIQNKVDNIDSFEVSTSLSIQCHNNTDIHRKLPNCRTAIKLACWIIALHAWGNNGSDYHFVYYRTITKYSNEKCIHVGCWPHTTHIWAAFFFVFLGNILWHCHVTTSTSIFVCVDFRDIPPNRMEISVVWICTDTPIVHFDGGLGLATRYVSHCMAKAHRPVYITVCVISLRIRRLLAQSSYRSSDEAVSSCLCALAIERWQPRTWLAMPLHKTHTEHPIC